MAYVLYVNGTEQDLGERRVSLETLAVSWEAPAMLRFVQHAPHTEAAFGVEDRVALSVDGTVRFRGRVKRADCEGVPGRERVAYSCLGLRDAAGDVTARDPDHGFPRVAFNAPADDEDYEAARSGRTVGEMIAWLFDEHAAELRAAGVLDDAPATGYVQAELDALDVVPPKVVLDSLDFEAALIELMRHQPGVRFRVDPDACTWHFVRIADLPETTVTYNSADKPLSALLAPSTEGRATAVEIVGPLRPVNDTITLSGGGLTKLWNAGYESDWTWSKCFDPAHDDTYAHVYRRFQVSDAARRRMARALGEPAGLGDAAAARCPQVYRKTPDGTWAWVPAMFDFAAGVILLAQPATVGDEYDPGAAECAEDLCLVYSYLAEPLSVRRPTSGYQGTAYTEPEHPVEVVRRLYDEHFILAEQVPHYEAAAAELLEATRDIVYEGAVRLGAADWSMADLGHRLHFAAQDDAGEPVATGFESLGAVLRSVTYDFGAARTELALSTDRSAFVQLGSAAMRELATQARRAGRSRALDACRGAPTPRAGNDGEIGAAANARGVYSLRRYEDGAAGRVAGHVDLEAGGGVQIERQVDGVHNGFRISAPRGQWFAFTCFLATGDELGPWTKTLYVPDVTSSPSSAGEIELPAGKVTAIRAVFATNITAGTLTLTPRKGSAADSRPDGDIDTWTDYDVPDGKECELASGGCSVRVDGWDFVLADGDTLGLRATAAADFEAEAPVCLYARVYYEEG
jgi:hypothetical protein